MRERMSPRNVLRELRRGLPDALEIFKSAPPLAKRALEQLQDGDAAPEGRYQRDRTAARRIDRHRAAAAIASSSERRWGWVPCSGMGCVCVRCGSACRWQWRGGAHLAARLVAQRSHRHPARQTLTSATCCFRRFFVRSNQPTVIAIAVLGMTMLGVLTGTSTIARAQSAAAPAAQYPDYPSETPLKFTPPTYGMDHEARDVMIPMRDGVKLHTLILVPKGARHEGILLTRTPYEAKSLGANLHSVHLGPRLWGYDNATETIVEGGYIRVIQDIRGKYLSEGDYVMNRPVHGTLNPTPVDESTDTYDTIDWLIKNVPESNGKVGVLGISYDGFLAAMPLVNPHPALKVAVPMNPMVDGWRGDDWFHNGAFRQQNIPYIYEQTATRSNDDLWQSSHFDDYDMYLRAVGAGELGRQRGNGPDRILEEGHRASSIRRLLERTGGRQGAGQSAADRADDDGRGPMGSGRYLWCARTSIRRCAGQSRRISTICSTCSVRGITGSRSMRPAPWARSNGAATPACIFASRYWRRFWRTISRTTAPAMQVAPVNVFETGTNRWQRLSPPGLRLRHWLPEPKATPLYLQAGQKIGISAAELLTSTGGGLR
jgi:hypothetical protein